MRDLAKGETLANVALASHLDADELSAFAENALPVKARLRVTEHLSDCGNCRQTLALLSTLMVDGKVKQFTKNVKR